MGNWRLVQKFEYCTRHKFEPFAVTLGNRNELESFTNALDRVARDLPVNQGQIHAMYLLHPRIEALLQHHRDVLTYPTDFNTFCLRVYECCWGPYARPEHRSIWFCKGIYQSQVLTKKANGELQIIYIDSLNRVMEWIVDALVAIVTSLRQQQYRRRLNTEEQMCVDAIYRIMCPGSSGLSLLSFFRQDQSYYKMRSYDRETMKQFKLLKKNLRADLIKNRWENMVLPVLQEDTRIDGQE